MEHFYCEEKEKCDSIQYGVWIDGGAYPLEKADFAEESPDFAVHYRSGYFPGISNIPMHLVRTYALRRTMTTSTVATVLGIARRTVQKWCAELGFARIGRDYLLTDEQIEQIRERAQDRPGRPRGSTL